MASTSVSKGSKTQLSGNRYTVAVSTNAGPGVIDPMAVLLGPNGRVRDDNDFIFFNQPTGPGVSLLSSGNIEVDLDAVPADIDRVEIAGSTENQGKTFAQAPGLALVATSLSDAVWFEPPGLTTESVVSLGAFYRKGNGWKFDATGQGYSAGLAAFANDRGISTDEPTPELAETPTLSTEAPISLEKVKVVMTKDSPNKTAKIDLRKSKGDPNYVLTVALEWDGRGARYDRHENVKSFGDGDLDVYFNARDEETNKWVAISGENGHRGDLDQWPFMHHHGDAKQPGLGGKPASERVEVKPNENGDLLVNIYQSVDNGSGAINEFGRPRVVVRYGRAGADGLPAEDADEITIYPGNNKNSYWATVAHIDVKDGILTVDGETRYSRPGSERMPGLDTDGGWVQEPKGGATGRSKKSYGTGLDRYEGRCPQPEIEHGL